MLISCLVILMINIIYHPTNADAKPFLNNQLNSASDFDDIVERNSEKNDDNLEESSIRQRDVQWVLSPESDNFENCHQASNIGRFKEETQNQGEELPFKYKKYRTFPFDQKTAQSGFFMMPSLPVGFSQESKGVVKETDGRLMDNNEVDEDEGSVRFDIKESDGSRSAARERQYGNGDAQTRAPLSGLQIAFDPSSFASAESPLLVKAYEIEWLDGDRKRRDQSSDDVAARRGANFDCRRRRDGCATVEAHAPIERRQDLKVMPVLFVPLCRDKGCAQRRCDDAGAAPDALNVDIGHMTVFILANNTLEVRGGGDARGTKCAGRLRTRSVIDDVKRYLEDAFNYIDVKTIFSGDETVRKRESGDAATPGLLIFPASRDDIAAAIAAAPCAPVNSDKFKISERNLKIIDDENAIEKNLERDQTGGLGESRPLVKRNDESEDAPIDDTTFDIGDKCPPDPCKNDDAGDVKSFPDEESLEKVTIISEEELLAKPSAKTTTPSAAAAEMIVEKIEIATAADEADKKLIENTEEMQMTEMTLEAEAEAEAQGHFENCTTPCATQPSKKRSHKSKRKHRFTNMSKREADAGSSRATIAKIKQSVGAVSPGARAEEVESGVLFDERIATTENEKKSTTETPVADDATAAPARDENDNVERLQRDLEIVDDAADIFYDMNDRYRRRLLSANSNDVPTFLGRNRQNF